MARRSKKSDDADAAKDKSKKKDRSTSSTKVEVDTRQPIVAVVLGSDTDFPVVAGCIETLEEFDIPYEARVISAHRTPDKAHKFASTARLKGFRVLIAAAGGAAHLAGVMASLTTRRLGSSRALIKLGTTRSARVEWRPKLIAASTRAGMSP